MQKYIVKREHLGDRDYLPGDEREANPSSVAHLVALGVLAPIDVAADPVEAPAPETKRTRRK